MSVIVFAPILGWLLVRNYVSSGIERHRPKGGSGVNIVIRRAREERKIVASAPRDGYAREAQRAT
jgi:hypothetical protein